MADIIDRLRHGKQYGYKVLFKGQDTRPVGKPGVILAEMGQPEEYEFGFYRDYMHHVFHYMLPFFIRGIVLADKGLGLIDPENPLAREAFEPRLLVDPSGSFSNKEGKPYVECEVTWRPPGMKKNPWDHGFFLYKGEGKSGSPDICDKVGAKVVGWYYGALIPKNKVPWRYQLRKVYDEAVAELRQSYPQAEFRQAYYTDEASMQQAVDDLLAAGCETIICQDYSNPVHSDFEDYAFTLPNLLRMVKGRAKVIYAEQLGNQPAIQQGYVQMVDDQLAALPPEASVCLILTAHGHPFKKETHDQRAPEYRDPITQGARNLLEKRRGRWDLIWSFDEYADPYWDPENKKLETLTAYERAIAAGYDYAIEFPTEFPAENTDLMIFHAMKKYTAFADYDRDDPIPYPDWDQPLVRTFHHDKTTGIYAGCPVGPYRKYVVEALVSSVRDVLDQA